MLVEFLVLLNMSLLTLLTLLVVQEDKLLHLTTKILLSKLLDAVFGHISIDISAFGFTGGSVFLQSSTKKRLDRQIARKFS